jgi:hypothetical protein
MNSDTEGCMRGRNSVIIWSTSSFIGRTSLTRAQFASEALLEHGLNESSKE